MGGFGCLYTRRMEWRWEGWAAAAAAASAGATPSFAGQPHKFLANTNRQEERCGCSWVYIGDQAN